MSAVGSDIEAICKKCGEVWHVVVAKVGQGIAKVQCKECHGYHRYRPIAGATTKATSTRRASSARKKATKSAPESSAPVEPDLSMPIKAYSIRETFDLRQRVDHPKFGIGVVESSPGPGKISVFFPSGRRLLAHGR